MSASTPAQVAALAALGFRGTGTTLISPCWVELPLASLRVLAHNDEAEP